MHFAASLLLLLWVVTSILGNGIALLHYSTTKLRGLELFGYGAAAGVLLHGFLGWGIAAFPLARWVFVATLIALSVASAVYFIARGVVPEFFQALSRSRKICLALWFSLLVLCLSLLHLEVRLPEPLPDGPYVFKTPTTNVKVQHLTSLPADNIIPYVVAEFFVRGVAFVKERPIMPANEVSNRTILMSLVTLPFRAAMGAPHDHPQLGTYNYVGRDWPDVAKLYAADSFEQFSVVALVLNSLLLVGVLVFFASFGATSVLPAAALLYVTNPYFIGQTIYSWPKAMAGFFILLAWNSIRNGHAPAFVAALFALAFHSHPYAIVFSGWAGLYYLIQWLRGESRLASVLAYLLVFALLLAPWIIWTRWMLQIPSDLIAQNLAGPGTEAAWTSPIAFVWIRLHNLFYTLFSTIFLVYPFDFKTVLNNWQFSLPGVLGMVLIYPALAQCATLPRPRLWLYYGFLGPALSILAVYSCPSLPVLHGYQPLVALFLCLGVWWLSQHCPRRVYLALIGLQLLLNLGDMLARGVITGAHF
ncbi:MAG TPA: hypothetical protein VM940_00150 [Chthoniobacterales bacterium]|nr:hypothetical protein [Chthoniobacterales bacterium]